MLASKYQTTSVYPHKEGRILGIQSTQTGLCTILRKANSILPLRWCCVPLECWLSFLWWPSFKQSSRNNREQRSEEQRQHLCAVATTPSSSLEINATCFHAAAGCLVSFFMYLHVLSLLWHGLFHLPRFLFHFSFLPFYFHFVPPCQVQH